MGNGIDTTDITLGPRSYVPNQYFANLPTKECAFEVFARVEEYYNEMRRTGRLALYRNAYTNYYMGWIYRASMWRGGEQGELTRSFWNHSRNILRHLKVQTTQNKIAYKTQVLNSNFKSANIVEFGNGLADRYSQSPEYDLDTKGKQGVEDTLVWGESGIVGLWNRFKGQPMGVGQQGEILKDGDMEYFNITPMDHIINCSLQSRDLLQWRVVRRWVNKYDLAAMYPALSGKVLEYNDSESSYASKLVTLIHHDDETIPVFYFFHDKTPAVPMGRLLLMADPECIFEDGPLDQGENKPGYDHIPVYDNIVEVMQGSPYGYTVYFDLIPIQQSLNELISACVTNNINFAIQCVMAMKGSNLQWQELATGMSFIEWDPKVGEGGKPEALNLLSSKPETYNFIEMHIKNMETIAGINSMVRGNPEGDITSGQYAALVTVQSVLFNSGLQKAYARQMEKLMTGTLKTIKKNMIGKKIARIVGETSEPYLKEFQASDLQDIESVSVQLVNPMIQTPAGKMAMAETLIKTGLIKDAQQYIEVYTEGDLPNLTRRQENQNKLIKQENEAIMKGQCPEVSLTDNHVQHILEQSGLLDTIEMRLNPNSPQSVAALAHLQKHINKLVGGIDPMTGVPEGPINPVLAGILGYPTLPIGTPSPAQLPPLQPGVPGEPPQPGAPQQKQPQSAPGTPSQPSQTLPENPAATGQPAMNGAVA